jgi:hypothetical protein
MKLYVHLTCHRSSLIIVPQVRFNPSSCPKDDYRYSLSPKGFRFYYGGPGNS